MTGMSRTIGTFLPFDAHLAQSINDILTTPLNTRVMRRDYGSDLPQLIDAPINGETIIDVFVATAEAIDRWEPRFGLRRVEADQISAGRMRLTLTGEVAGSATTVVTDLGAEA